MASEQVTWNTLVSPPQKCKVEVRKLPHRAETPLFSLYAPPLLHRRTTGPFAPGYMAMNWVQGWFQGFLFAQDKLIFALICAPHSTAKGTQSIQGAGSCHPHTYNAPNIPLQLCTAGKLNDERLAVSLNSNDLVKHS